MDKVQMNYKQEMEKIQKFYKNESEHADKISYYLNKKIEAINRDLHKKSPNRYSPNFSPQSEKDYYQDEEMEYKNLAQLKKASSEFGSNNSGRNSLKNVSFKEIQEDYH